MPLLGHFLDRVAHAFAAEARVLDAAVGHVVDAEAGDVADDHAADLEPVPGPHRVRQPAGEHARLQSEVAVVDARQGIVEVIERLHAGNRAEGLRSEEHTSELQSLMRNSYAVFCLKKKTQTKHHK